MGLYITAVTLGIFGGIAGSLILRLLWPSMATTDDGEPREVRTTNLTLVDAEGRERGCAKACGRQTYSASHGRTYASIW